MKAYWDRFRQFWTRRRLLYVVIPLFFLVGLVTVASQRWAMQWIVEQAVAAKGEKITFEGVSGSLFHELQAEKIVYEGREREITIKGLVFRWNPLHLLHGKADIDELSVASLEIDLVGSSNEPLKLPQSLAPPVSLDVQHVVIDSLAVKKMGVGVTLENVRCILVADDGEWQLKELTFDSPFGNVAVNANLRMEQPFTLSGKARFDNEETDAHMAFDAGGTLDRMQLSGSLNGYGATGDLKAVVTPFAPFMFESLELKASNINPSKIDDSWPVAEFGASAHIRIRDDRTVEGSLNVVNGKPGVIEKQMLPIHAVRATLGGTSDVLEMSPLVIDLGAGGTFSGVGHFSETETTITLKTGGFNLHGITEKLRPTHAAGTVGYHRVNGTQEVTADLNESHIRLKADVLKSEDLLELKEFLLTADGGSVSMTGHLNLDEDKDFTLKGNVSRFNFAALGALPPSNLNVEFGASGALLPEWKADASFAFGPSTLFNQPISGQGKFQIRGKDVTDASVRLALGANTFNASGSLGSSGGQIDWRLNAPVLGVMGHGFKGALSGNGTLSGALDDLQGTFSLGGSDFMLMDMFGAHQLKADAEFGTTLSGRIDANLAAEQVTIGATHWSALNLQTEGTWHSHTLNASIKNSQFDLFAKLSGGLTSGGEWVGTISQLENRGPQPFRLSSSADFRVGPDSFSIEDMSLNLPEGEINIDKLIKKHSRLETSGNAHGVPLNWLLSLSDDASEKLRASLTFGADWSIRADHALSGDAHIYRENGDIRLNTEDNHMRLGINAMDIRAVFSNSNVDVHLTASSDKFGETDATLRTRLAYRHGSWGVSKDSPLQLTMKSDMPSIRWIGPLTGQPDLELDGEMTVNVTGTGSLGTPRLSGTVSAKDLSVDWLSTGVHLGKGELVAALDGNRLSISKGVIHGDEGTLQIGGGVVMQNGMLNGNLKLHADRLLALSNVDRQLVVSGDGAFTLDDSGLSLNGDWHVDRAKIVMANASGGVTRSKDVVVLGREAKKEVTTPFRFRIHADLGNHFMLQAMGVDTRLAGALTAVADAGGHLQLNGAINTVDGIFNAYGQKLVIRKGQATFNGVPDNPSIEVVAVKLFSATDDVKEVGVRVTGTAQNPRVKLYSRPDVPDSEKLSWLVLGYGGGENGSAQQRSALAAAGAAIASSTPLGGLSSGLSQALGVDVGFASSSQVDDTVLALSRRIASNLYLSYEQGLTGALSVVKLRYKISRRLSLVGQTGTITAVDLLYDWKFD